MHWSPELSKRPFLGEHSLVLKIWFYHFCVTEKAYYRQRNGDTIDDKLNGEKHTGVNRWMLCLDAVPHDVTLVCIKVLYLLP